MEGDCHDTVSEVECFLYSVAMVNININIQNTRVVSEEERKDGMRKETVVVAVRWVR